MSLGDSHIHGEFVLLFWRWLRLLVVAVLWSSFQVNEMGVWREVV